MRIQRLVYAIAIALSISPLFGQTDNSSWQTENPSIPDPPAIGTTSIFSNTSLKTPNATDDSANLNSAVAQDQDDEIVPLAPNLSGQVGSEPPLSVPSNAMNGRNGSSRGRCNLGCPKSLFGRTAGGLGVGGWVETGFQNRSDLMFNELPGKFEVDQVWLYLDKPTSCRNRFGFHLDAVYGVDGQDLQAFGNPPAGNPVGWDNNWDHGIYGWALPQAYVEVGNGRSTVRAGKFLAPFGYEGLPATDNFFYSHTYTRYFTEPVSQTGVVGEFGNGCNSVMLGATAGWDTAFKNTDHGFNGIVGLQLRLGNNLRMNATSAIGDMGLRGSGSLTSIVMEACLSRYSSFVSQMDVLDLNIDSANEISWINYFFYSINPCLGLGTRLEWWKSNNPLVITNGTTSSTWDWTMGINYRPNANVVIRPELRYDWGAAALSPGATIFAVDAIVTF